MRTKTVNTPSQSTLLRIHLQSTLLDIRPLPSISSPNALLAVLSSKNVRLRALNRSQRHQFVNYRLLRQAEQVGEQLWEEGNGAKQGVRNGQFQTIQMDPKSKYFDHQTSKEQLSTNSKEMRKILQENVDKSMARTLSALKLDQNQQVNQYLSKYQKFLPQLLSLPLQKYFSAYLEEEHLDVHHPLTLFKCFFDHYFPQTPSLSPPHQLSFLETHIETALVQIDKSTIQSQNFWNQILFLMAKPPKYHNLIEIHLNYWGESTLLPLFKLVTSGQSHSFPSFSPNSEPEKIFFLLLKRQWKPEPTSALSSLERLGLICKQIHLKRLFNESQEAELGLLEEEGRLQLHTVCREETGFELLLALGQIGKTVELLEQLGTIDAIQALLVLSQLYCKPQTNILLYQHKDTDLAVERILARVVINLVSSESSLIASLLTVFSSLLCSLPLNSSSETHPSQNTLVADSLFLAITLLQLAIVMPSFDIREIVYQVNSCIQSIQSSFASISKSLLPSLGRQATSNEAQQLLMVLSERVKDLWSLKLVVKHFLFFGDVLSALKGKLLKGRPELVQATVSIDRFFEYSCKQKI